MPTGTQSAPDEFTKAITTVVRLKMQWLKQSKADIERLTGIPHGTFSRIINDQRIPDITQLRLMAAAVQVPLPSLIEYAEGVAGGAEPPFEKIYRTSPKEAYREQLSDETDLYDIDSDQYWGGVD